MRKAPAVCEEEGPTIMGPRTSNADIEIIATPKLNKR